MLYILYNSDCSLTIIMILRLLYCIDACILQETMKVLQTNFRYMTKDDCVNILLAVKAGNQ